MAPISSGSTSTFTRPGGPGPLWGLHSHHLPVAPQPCAVHLGDGGRGQRLWIELGEDHLWDPGYPNKLGLKKFLKGLMVVNHPPFLGGFGV